MNIKKLLKETELFVERTGLSLFLIIITATIMIVITVVSWFYADIYKVISTNHVFEALVLAVLIEIVLLLTQQSSTNQQFEIFMEESLAQEKMFELIEQGSIARARILSAGMNSRRLLIARLAKAGVAVQVLAQDPDSAIDKVDAQRTLDTIALIRDDVGEAYLSNLNISFHLGLATLRVVILYEKNSNIKHLFLGWYNYRNGQVYGSHNPTIYIATRTHKLLKFSEWVDMMVDIDAKGARKVPSKKRHRTTSMQN
jgi:hypothetical protein